MIMKTRKQPILSAVSILLAAIMCLSLFPMSASAAETKRKPAGAPDGSHSYVAISDQSAKAPSSDYSEGFQYAYTNKHGAKSLFSGAMTYDLKSNTLTLTNLSEQSRFMEICNMGDDFKIKVNGTNTVASISLFGYEGDCSVTFTGDGTLNVTDYGIDLYGGNRNAVLTIEKDVTLNATYDGGGDSAIKVSGSTASSPIVLKAKEKSGGKAGRVRMQKAEIPWHYDLNQKSQYYVFYNPTKPYSRYKDFTETVYFGINEPITYKATRRSDNMEHDCLRFTIMALEEDGNGSFIIKQTITNTYVWDDDPLYEVLLSNYRNVTYDMVDPNYELVDTSHLTDMWSIVNSRNDALTNVRIIPSDGSVTLLPEIMTATLPNGITGSNFSAQIEAQPANGGSITSFTLGGNASDWLKIDDSGYLSGKPSKAGHYNITVTAVESANGKTYESAPISLGLTVNDPNNKVKIENKIDDKAYHKLVVRKKSDNSVVKTLNLESRAISAGTTYYLGSLHAGEYEVEFCGEVTGGTVTYADSKTDLTVEESSINNISLSPRNPSFVPNDKSVMVKLKDESKYSDKLQAIAALSNGEKRYLYISNQPEKTITPDILKNGAKVESVGLYVYDMFGNQVDITKGEPEIDGNTYTLDIDTDSFTEYTVSGIPDEVSCIYLKYGENTVGVRNGGRYYAKTFTEESKPTVSNVWFYGYDTNTFYSNKPVMTIEGDEIKFEFAPLERDATLSGKLEDEDGNPIAGAAITISQDMSYISSSLTTVTDSDGAYKAEGLYSDIPVKVYASAAGFGADSKEIGSLKKSEKLDFTLEKQNAITLTITDGDVHNATIRWSATRFLSGVSGSRFTLELPPDVTDGKYTVSMSADDIVGTTTGTVSVQNGFASLELTPTRKGTISWYEPDEELNPVNDYSGYYVSVGNGSNYLAGQINSVDLDPGEYTVSLRKNIYDAIPVISQKLTVRSGETVYLTEKLPETAEVENTATANFTAPDKAMTGELYRVSGVINAIDDKYITAINLQSFLERSSSANYIQYATINGRRVDVEYNKILRKNNEHADWSLPLNLTLYCKQTATKSNPSQTVSVFVNTSTNPDNASSNISDAARVASVTTRFSPSITLDIAEEISGTAQTDEKGNKYFTPNPVNFYGRALANTEVKIYDNDVLCAVTKANYSGVYSGNFTFATDSVLHNIRAEAMIDGETASVNTSCSYVPENATLKEIYIGFNDSWTTAQRVPLRGESMYSYRDSPKNFVFFSRFDNEDKLDDLIYTVDGEEVTAKVFFRITTTYGKTYTVPAEKDDRGYKSKALSLYGEYPNGVKVLYLSKDTSGDHSTKINYDDEEYDVDMALKRINVDSPEDGSYVSDSDYTQWFKNIYAEYKKAQKDDKDKSSTGAPDSDSKEEPKTDDKEPQEISTDEAHEVMVWMMNKGEGPGSFDNITPAQASEKAPEDKYKMRTYTDSQPWTYTKQNFKLRQQEFRYKGYVATTYTDESTGHTMFMFTGTFYYDRYAMPVPSLSVEKVYSGIKKTEDDPRMFQKSSEDKGGDKKGKMLGSQLDVTYCFDSVTKTWFRLQTATISPGAKSPIHTAASQIPCKTDAPYSYTPANVHMISSTGSDTKSKSSTGASAKAATGDGNKWSGIDFSIDVTKISAKTWVSGAISVGGAAYGKFAKNTYIGPNCKVPANAPFNKYKKFGINSLDVVEESLQHYAGGNKSMYQIGVTAEGLAGAGTTFTLNKVNDATHKSNGSANDGLDYLEKQLRDNMRYWGNVKSVANATADGSNGGIIGNFELDKYAADDMIYRTRRVADKLTAIQKAVEDSQTQDNFTKSCTDALGYASLVTSLIPAYGTACALTLDSVSFLLSAANDTRNAKVQQAVKEFLQEYAEYLEMDEEEKRKLEEDDELVKSHQNMGANVKTRKQVAAAGGGGGLVDPMGGGDKSSGGSTQSDVNMTPVHDPSGIVYEAVLSNPVEGAEVTLYNYENAENPMNLWDDSSYLGQDNPLSSDSEGYYRWDVPEGEWYVTAKKDGYELGNSGNDVEATVKHGDNNYLPVMPPQLNVNIPLVSYEAPEVESAFAKTDGVYITFKKYMDESTLTKDNFVLTDPDGNEIKYTLEKLDSEHAPSNITYEGKAPSYTRTVKLSAKLNAEDEVTLKVDSGVKSYAGVNIAVPYGEILTVEKKIAAKAPELSVKAGKVSRGTVLELTAENGAEIIYTTDGTAPSDTNGKRVKSGYELVIVQNMTVKAIAVKLGFNSSEVTEADYTLKMISDDLTPPDEPQNPTDPTTPTEPTTPVKTAKLNKTSANLNAGGTLTLKVTNGTVKSWKTSKKTIATVTKKGKVTALTKGSATITATLTNGKKLTCKVKVKTSPTIKIGKKKYSKKTTYKVKRNKTLTVKITGKASSVKNIYKTSKKKIAKITSKKTAKKVVIKAYKKKGKATITLKVNGKAFKIKVKVV